jgi:hypothetical protein
MKIEVNADTIRRNLPLSMTVFALVLFGVGVILFSGQIFSSGENPTTLNNPRTPADQERAYLLRQKVWLMAQINLCAEESQARPPGSRSVCPPENQARVPEYRKQIGEIDRRLEQL